MEFLATQQYLRLSPRKARPVADLVRKMRPAEAVAKLPFTGRKTAEFLVKVIKQALANAKAKGVSENDLYFKEIQISEGPRLKRGRAVSRGQWHPIKKRMSHIRVILEERKVEVKKEQKPLKAEKGTMTKDKKEKGKI